MFDVFGIDALSVLVFGPALSAFVVAAFASLGPSKQFGRWLALILSLLLALMAIKVFADYQAAGIAIGDDQFIVNAGLYPGSRRLARAGPSVSMASARSWFC